MTSAGFRGREGTPGYDGGILTNGGGGGVSHLSSWQVVSHGDVEVTGCDVTEICNPNAPATEKVEKVEREGTRSG